LWAVALTVVVTTDFPHQKEVSIALAIALTFFAAIESVLQPSRRYLEYVKRAIELEEWRYDLENQVDILVLSTAGGPDREEKIRALLDAKNKLLSKIGDRLALNLIT
jgi:hypothetical protein